MLKKAKAIRSNSGSYLIELLVALAISGFLAVALGASLSEQLRASSGAENQTKAADLAEQVLERVRESSQVMPTYGTYPISVRSDDGVALGQHSFDSRALSLDASSFTVSSGDKLVGPGGNQNATVVADFSGGPTTTSSELKVTVTWSENQSTRTAVFTTVLSKTPAQSNPGVHL